MAAEIFTAVKQTTFKDQITGVLAKGLVVGKATHATENTDASAMTIDAYTVSAAQSGYAHGLYVTGPLASAASATTMANVITTYIAAPTKSGSASITNAYALRLAAPSAADTENYSLWAEGSAKIDGTSILLGTKTNSVTTATVGGAYTGNILKIASTAGGTINLTTDVTSGTVNIFDSVTGTANIVKAATTINIGSITAASTMNLGGGNAVAATLVIGGTVTSNTLKLRSINSGSINLTTDATTTDVNIFTAATGMFSIGSGSSTINMGGAVANTFTLNLGKGNKPSALSFLSAGTNTVTIDSGATSGIISLFTSPTGSANILTASTGTITIGGSGSTTVIGGNLTVNGTVTTINSNTLTVDDKNIELASVSAITSLSGTVTTVSGVTTITSTNTAGMIPGMVVTRVGGSATLSANTTIVSVDSPTQITISPAAQGDGSLTDYSVGGATNATADGAGFTVKGSSDKTLSWINATGAWTSSEHFNILTGKTYKINGTDALSATALTLFDSSGTPQKATISLPGSLTANNQTITLPNATSTVATLELTEALQNKILAGADKTKSRIQFSFDQGATSTQVLTLGWIGTNARSIAFPDANGTLLTTETGLGLIQGTSGTMGDASVMANTRTTFGNYTFRGSTTGAVSYVRLTETGAAYSSGYTVEIPVKSTVNANINISAYNYSDSTSASWQINATFSRGATGNAILLGDPLVTASSSSGMEACAVDIDPASDSIKIQVAGIANKTIYWAAAVSTIQITYIA
jgi:hypothetical protein